MILDRIKQYIDSKGISVSAFERSIGMSNASFGKSLKKGGAIGSDKLEIILRVYPDLSPDWLMTGAGNMLNEDGQEPKGNAELLGFAVPAPREATVPVRFYEPEPSATFREFCVGVNESPDTINILPEQADTIDDLSCVFVVSGDSMAPQIQDKAKILCREVIPSRWHYLRHGIIAIVYDDRFVIKRVKKNCLDDGNYILLSSDNPDYPGTEKAYLGGIRCIFEVLRVISQRVQ